MKNKSTELPLVVFSGVDTSHYIDCMCLSRQDASQFCDVRLNVLSRCRH